MMLLHKDRLLDEDDNVRSIMQQATPNINVITVENQQQKYLIVLYKLTRYWLYDQKSDYSDYTLFAVKVWHILLFIFHVNAVRKRQFRIWYGK
jgi:hypothetical protein